MADNLMEAIKRDGKRSEKPIDVKIMPPLSMMAVPSKLGGVSLLIVAVGSDDKVYNWESSKGCWVLMA